MLTNRQTGITKAIGTFRQYTNAFSKHFSPSDRPEQLYGQLSIEQGEGYCAGNADGAEVQLNSQIVPNGKNARSHTSIPPNDAVLY